MSASSEIIEPNPGTFDSLNCVDVVCDIMGDSTVRPMRPELMRLALLEREELARWEQINPPTSSCDASGATAKK